jgi:hypothetical protein
MIVAIPRLVQRATLWLGSGCSHRDRQPPPANSIGSALAQYTRTANQPQSTG